MIFGYMYVVSLLKLPPLPVNEDTSFLLGRALRLIFKNI